MSDGTEPVALEANKYESTETCLFILSISAEMSSNTHNSKMLVQWVHHNIAAGMGGITRNREIYVQEVENYAGMRAV